LSEGKVTDVLGIKPIGDAALKIVEGVGAFLNAICRPAAEEYGMYLRDRVHLWRTKNLVRVAQAAERKLNEAGGVQNLTAPPRLVAGILDQGSWVDDPELQELWGGLLASSCSQDGADDSNLVFLNLLSGLTGPQARVLKYACEHAPKFMTATGLPLASQLVLQMEELFAVSGVRDVGRLDRELDLLRNIGLLNSVSGLGLVGPLAANVTPSALGLHFYVRCQGSREAPAEYFKITEVREAVLLRGFAQQAVWRPVEAISESHDDDESAGGPDAPALD
jgi:hypothetical protein